MKLGCWIVIPLVYRVLRTVALICTSTLAMRRQGLYGGMGSLAAPRNTAPPSKSTHGGRIEPISAIAGGVGQGLFEVRRRA